MVDPDRRPTAQEIEELIDLVRRDPGSPAFIDLGEAYLALGRPRDAVKVANVGLESSPDSLEGRVMLARAHAAMHQWKEAQGELLRVVKIDRSNRQGFALLGEVLLRRSDFERAVPVLQHAQNLDPTSPTILSMLKRARSGQALDPPAPIPTPVPPRGETDNGAEIDHRRSVPAMGGMAPQVVPTASPQARTLGIQVPPAGPPPAPRPAPAELPDASPGGFTLPSSSASPMAPAPAPAPVPRAPKPTAPPPVSIEGVRPRVVQREKVANAAAASLRQSAAVGENYLNDLLTGGLLDVAGVHTENEFDLRPDRRWGRSTRRAFIFLFVVLVIGIGGGGTWYWWSEKQKAEAVARLQKESKQAIGLGDFDGLELSIKKLTESLDKDNRNLLTFAYYVETAGLEALLYGTEADRVDRAYKAAKDDIKPEAPGYRELVIGKAALELSRLGTGDGDPGAVAAASKSTLAEVLKSLDERIAKDASDQWAQWLKGRALLAAGERKAAKAQFKTAADGDKGLVLAMIDYADMLVDEGSLDEALAIYDKAIERSKPTDVTKKALAHPLAVIGRAVGRAEASVQINEAIDELNTQLVQNIGPRVGAYKALAMALANGGIEDFTKSAEALTRATAAKPPNEVRFWARVGWAHYAAGNFADAATARAKIAWYGKSAPEDDPAVKLVDAGLTLASGLPEKALEIASKLEGVRARIIRIYALLDLGRAKEALAEADEVLKKAPENQEAMILREQARVIGSTDKERTDAAEALERLARKARSKLGRHAYGIALIATGDAKGAQTQLEQAVTGISVESPNPLAYRTRTALAELLLAANDLAGATKMLDEALTANPGYFPTLGLQAKVALRNNDPDRALDLLAPIFNESAAVTPNLQLVLAEALIVSKKTSAKQKEQAKKLLEELKDKITPATEVSRVAALLDPNLVKELGLPELEEEGKPEAATEPKKKAPTPKRRRR
ncbi:MAG: tetratricopeptide repeat protein [Kofleriaceae bacterium]|nr:tetratricopeptide repeat protein [Kofleriaceae bacterium]